MQHLEDHFLTYEQKKLPFMIVKLGYGDWLHRKGRLDLLSITNRGLAETTLIPFNCFKVLTGTGYVTQRFFW